MTYRFVGFSIQRSRTQSRFAFKDLKLTSATASISRKFRENIKNEYGCH